MGELEKMCIHIGEPKPTLTGEMAAGAFAWEMQKCGFNVEILNMQDKLRVYVAYWASPQGRKEYIKTEFNFAKAGFVTYDSLRGLIEYLIVEANKQGANVNGTKRS